MLYTARRLLLPITGFGLWAWLRDGTPTDPANALLVVSVVAFVIAVAAVRRYWFIRKTSRSRRDSSLLS